MRRRLDVQLGLAMTAVAVLVALVAGVLLSPLLSGSGEQALRESTARQADLLARLPVQALAAPRAGRLAARSDLELGVVLPDGSRSGAAAALAEADVERLLSGSDVSTEGELDGADVLLEGRPGRGGGGVVVAADRSVGDDLTSSLRRRVLLAIVLGLAAAGLATWLLARRLGRPLAATAAAARRLADGERGVPLPRTGTAEVDDLVEALRGLDSALATSEGRQRDFLLSVSHELRTPLTTIRGYAEALADGVVEADEAASVGALLRAESERLERYVADLLALARLQADDFDLHLGVVDVADLARTAALAWQPRASGIGVTVTADAPDPAPTRTDATRVRQVVDALVDNAVRVCGPGDRVVVAVTTTPSGVRLEVRDSGPGLTSDDAAVAFEPGVLHERYAGTRPSGTGLGLAIVGRLVTRLGGRVAVERAPEGGAAFVVDLP